MEDDLLEGGEELLFDNESDLLVEETSEISEGELLFNEDEEIVFDTDPVDFNNDLSESSISADIGTDQQVNDEVFDFQNDLENLAQSAAEIERVGADAETSNDDEILESLQIIQRNVKTGFDNLSLMGTVQTSLISFSIGAIIIYCYIGRFK